MICADTSSLIAFINGNGERDVELVAEALAQNLLVLSPVSVAELLSDPNLPSPLQETIIQIPRLGITPGYWERAGRLRAQLIRHHYRPKIPDTLIAQPCLDYRVPLLTRDKDFAPFQRLSGLRLL
jgi:predicted nucleic acid-binding protein